MNALKSVARTQRVNINNRRLTITHRRDATIDLFIGDGQHILVMLLSLLTR